MTTASEETTAVVHDNPDYNKYDINGRKIPTPERKPDDEEEEEEDEDGNWRGKLDLFPLTQ